MKVKMGFLNFYFSFFKMKTKGFDFEQYDRMKVEIIE